ncbi:nitrate- and nitrite sensing domain-containing protein [Streptomyces sp. NPDC088197]|uniref:sensor histidine kinase n=1 Tax=Streptomyces sp. NPDC088197 TaxID=3365840 RepID=UPI0037FF8DAD
MQGRFKRDSGAAGDPEQQPGGTGNGPTPQQAGDSASTAPGTTAATGRPSTPSGIEAGKITGLAGKPGPRIAMRNWRISTRLVSLLALPVVTATVLGGMRINSSLDNINQLEHMKTLTDITEHATQLAAALQEERDSSAGPLSSGDKTNDAVEASRQATDREYKQYLNASDNVSERDPVFSGVRATLLAIGTQLANLAEIRDEAYTSTSTISQTVSQYDDLVQSLLSLSQDMAQATNNPEMIQSTRALAAFSSAKEYESIQRAVISAALATGGKLNANDYQSVKYGAANEDTALTRFQKIYGPKSAALLTPIEGGNLTISAHDTTRQRIAASQNAITKIDSSYLDWDDAAKTKIQAMSQIERSLLNEMQQKALKLQSEAKQSALISGAIILLVLGVAVVGAFIVARSMIRSLRRLQQTANDVAQKRLPELVKQLSETDPQDVDTSVESIGINSRDEIGQVARAFDEVHSEAVRLAAEQALLRGNVNAMFTNLSRRSQGLIQRQLSLISELESREADPDQLSSLFKLDHLATRMRRNGENLLVLAGEEPGRRWTRPVPLVDVLRAAASEVEQYERIELTSVPSAEVTGRIVNDLVHLLAELLENATSFSSPQTKVKVTGHSLPDGRVLIEIHDTGIGLSPEDLADINERLANPPTVDVSVSRRMGLFVVGRLSLRHGIRIQLRPSDSGGTTALVMLPVDVTQGGRNPKNIGQMGGGRPAGAPPAAAGSGIAGAFGNSPNSAPVNRPPQRTPVAGGQQRPALSPGAGRPGGPPQQGGTPRWAQDQNGGQQGFPDDRGLQDTPRGHEDVEAASAFDAPGQGPRGDFQQPGGAFGRPPGGGQDFGQGGQGGQQGGQNFSGRQGGQQGGQQSGQQQPGQFPPPQPQSTGPSGFRSDVFGGRSGPAPRQNGPADTAQFPPVRDDDFAPTGQGNQSQGGQGQGNQGNQGGGRGTGDTGQFPVQGGPNPGLPQRGARSPEETYSTGQFAMPGQPQGGQGQGGPGDTAQFPAVQADGTGEFRMPGQQPQGRPGQGGQQGQGGQPGQQQGFPGNNQYQGPPPSGPRPDAFPGQGLPQRGGPQQGNGGQGYDQNQQQYQDPYGTGQFPVQPQQPQQGNTGQYPVQQPMQSPQQPQAPQPQPQQQPQQPAEPMALPPAPTRGDEPTPIFSSIESDWFRTGQAERMQQIHVEQSARGQEAPPVRPVGRTAPPAAPQRFRPQRPGTTAPGVANGNGNGNGNGGNGGNGNGNGVQRPGGGQQQPVQAPPASVPASAQYQGQAPAAPVAQPLPRETPNWRTSPNDALRQRAEQIREPSAGGVTPSGLPRRVPRANLVAGGAAPQQAPQGGPQISRAPDDVRGRLTNLRRGIQQGREAGGNTDGRGFGTNQER